MGKKKELAVGAAAAPAAAGGRCLGRGRVRVRRRRRAGHVGTGSSGRSAPARAWRRYGRGGMKGRTAGQGRGAWTSCGVVPERSCSDRSSSPTTGRGDRAGARPRSPDELARARPHAFAQRRAGRSDDDFLSAADLSTRRPSSWCDEVKFRSRCQHDERRVSDLISRSRTDLVGGGGKRSPQSSVVSTHAARRGRQVRSTRARDTDAVLRTIEVRPSGRPRGDAPARSPRRAR
jgi:hypothetical protein